MGKLKDVWSLPVANCVFDSGGLDKTLVEMLCRLDAGKADDVSMLDPDGLVGAPEVFDCPSDTGKLKDVLPPVPGMVLVPAGSEGAAESPVEIVCPLDMGKLKEVMLPDPDGLGEVLVVKLDCPLDTGKLKEVS